MKKTIGNLGGMSEASTQLHYRELCDLSILENWLVSVIRRALHECPQRVERAALSHYYEPGKRTTSVIGGRHRRSPL